MLNARDCTVYRPQSRTGLPMIKRFTTFATVTAFVSAVGTPATAQRRRPRGRPAAEQPAATPAAPAADAQTVEARREYDEGVRQLNAGQNDAALVHFQRAFELRPNP